MKRTILITGVSGYIGSHLSKFLESDKDVNIINITRKNGYDLSSAHWTALLPDIEVDTVIHLAQSNYYRKFPDNTKDMVKVNIEATADLLDWSRIHSVERFIFASTGNVYGKSIDKLNEDSPLEPASFYGATKLCAEQLVNQYKNYFQIVTLRLFGVFGPHQKNMLIPNIIEKIIKGQEIQLADGVGIYITPIYIEDCVKIISELSNKLLNNQKYIINICSSDIISYADIVKKIEKIINCKAIIKLTEEEIKYFVGNNGFLKNLLGYTKFTRFSDGLKTMV